MRFGTRAVLPWLIVPLIAGCFAENEPVGQEGNTATNDGPAADDPDEPASSGAPAGALTGEYDAELRTVSCSGACAVPTATSILGPLSYCDVGDTDYDYIEVDHDDGFVTLDLARGRAEGSIDGDGNFSVSGHATEAGGGVKIDATIEGAFMGRHGGFTGTLVFTAKGDHYGDAIDCRGEMEVVAAWASDACEGRADACPDAYPICYLDVCNAGVAEDPCWEDEHCAEGLICHSGACLEPAPVGGACEYDDDECQGDAVCFEDVCQAGNPGDPCNFDDHCAGDHVCASDVCTTGELGDVCTYDDHCDEGLLCVMDVCGPGAPGDACEWDDDCASDDCVNDLCA